MCALSINKLTSKGFFSLQSSLYLLRVLAFNAEGLLALTAYFSNFVKDMKKEP
jgi:hypothetical protein